MEFRPSSWRTTEEPKHYRQRSTVVGMYPTQLNVNRPEIGAGVTVKEEHDQNANRHSSTLQASNPRSRALPSTPSSSIDVVKKEDTEDHHSAPLPPGTNTQVHQPGAPQSPYEQKKAIIKTFVDSAVAHFIENGSPEVGQTFNRLFEQSTRNPVLLDLYAAVCSGNARAKDLRDFKVSLRYSKRLLDHERNNRDEFLAQEPAKIAAELARLDARLTQVKERAETQRKRNLAVGFAPLAELWRLLARLTKGMATMEKHIHSEKTLQHPLKKDPLVPSDEAPANRPQTRPIRPQAQMRGGSGSHRRHELLFYLRIEENL